MSPKQDDSGWTEPKPTALLVLADGTVLEGFGLGATGRAVGEVCFNTAMTGYEEILTDPSYAGQIITFTFPHIGNVGTNEEDIETVNMAATPGARGVILRIADHRSVELPRHAPSRPVAESARHHRPLRARHPRADRTDPRQGHAERGDRARSGRQLRPRSAEAGGARVAGPRRHGPRADGHERAALHLGRDALAVRQGLRPPDQARVPRGRDRLRHQAQHPAPARGLRLPRHGGAGQDRGRGDFRAQARRRVSLERPRRSRRHRRIRRAGDPQADRQRHADLRHLPRPPDAGHRARRRAR